MENDVISEQKLHIKAYPDSNTHTKDYLVQTVHSEQEPAKRNQQHPGSSKNQAQNIHQNMGLFVRHLLQFMVVALDLFESPRVEHIQYEQDCYH